MSNVVNKNPIKIDTVMGSTFLNTTGHAPATGPIKLIEVYWLNPAASGDTFVIEDGDGNVIRTGRCESANQSQLFDENNLEVADFQVTTLGSGTLYIKIAR